MRKEIRGYNEVREAARDWETWKFAAEPNLVWVDEPLADGSTTRYLDKFKEIHISLT